MPLKLVSHESTNHNHLPGGPIAEWNRFNENAIGELPGFMDPEGRYFPLVDGESIVYVSKGKGREPYIQTDEGLVSFEDWGPRIVADNIERLRESGEVGEYLMPFYEAALVFEPRLQEVVVNTSDRNRNPVLAKTGGFANHRGQTVSGKYEISMNTGDGWKHFDTLLSSRRASAEVSAHKVGINPADLTPQLLAGFIFLHELGHIVDYMDHAPEFHAAKKRREADLNTLPWKGWNPAALAKFLEAPEGKEYWSKNEKSFAQAGYATPQAFLERQEAAYHTIETEDNPDQFAAKIMKAMGFAV